MDASTRWGFDIDSVVGDLSEILERIAWEEFGIRIARAQFTEFNLEECLPYEPEFIIQWLTRALQPHWTSQMKPYPDAVEVLTELAELEPLRFVTARSDHHTIWRWLKSHLTEVPNNRIHVEAVGHSRSKLGVLVRWGVSHFVEDRLETCEQLHQNGIVPVVFHQPWNRERHGFMSVESWREIRSLINGAR
jgi:uncharacterized HAD superfamily protein